MGETIVQWFGKDEEGGSRCGYCKSADTSISTGMWAHTMSCQTYENLLNRGWRRSGQYCYKPAMNKTCCPQYTIKCDVTQFKLSKSQRKALKTLNKFLISGKMPSKNSVSSNDDRSDTVGGKTTKGECSVDQVDTTVQTKDCGVGEPSSSGIDKQTEDKEKVEELLGLDENQQDQSTGADTNKKEQSRKSVMGADPNKPKCRKAKEIRKERKFLKMSQKGEASTVSSSTSPSSRTADLSTVQENHIKSIEELIEDLPKDLKHKLEFKLVNVKDKAKFQATFDAEFTLYSKYQHIIHDDTYEELTTDQFKRFLCDGPLHHVPPSDDDKRIPSTGLGAFHHQYYLDGKLIAVGVIDILPHCVSSKYFFYDPDYMFLSLGTYSALREIYFIRSLHRGCSEIKYYYMGFYIHTCPKMKYKARYTPSFLLCPETYIWQPVQRCIPKFDVAKYSRLVDDKLHKPPSTPDINSVLVILNNNNIKTLNKFVKKMGTREKLKHTSGI